MYHIKSDKRSQSSAAEIARGLQECMKTIPLKSVTVSDIHRATGISRATFYRLFDTPEDVLYYRLDQLVEGAEDYYENQRELPLAKILEGTIALGIGHHEFLKALIDNGRFDLLYQYTEKNFRSLDAKRAIFPKDMEPLEREYVISHLSMGMVATQITWARNGQRETAADLVRYLKGYVQVVSGLIEE